MQPRVKWSKIGIMAALTGFVGVLLTGVPLGETILAVVVFVAFAAAGALAGVLVELVRFSRRSDRP